MNCVVVFSLLFFVILVASIIHPRGSIFHIDERPLKPNQKGKYYAIPINETDYYVGLTPDESWPYALPTLCFIECVLSLVIGWLKNGMKNCSSFYYVIWMIFCFQMMSLVLSYMIMENHGQLKSLIILFVTTLLICNSGYFYAAKKYGPVVEKPFALLVSSIFLGILIMKAFLTIASSRTGTLGDYVKMAGSAIAPLMTLFVALVLLNNVDDILKRYPSLTKPILFIVGYGKVEFPDEFKCIAVKVSAIHNSHVVQLEKPQFDMFCNTREKVCLFYIVKGKERFVLKFSGVLKEVNGTLVIHPGRPQYADYGIVLEKPAPEEIPYIDMNPNEKSVCSIKKTIRLYDEKPVKLSISFISGAAAKNCANYMLEAFATKVPTVGWFSWFFGK